MTTESISLGKLVEDDSIQIRDGEDTALTEKYRLLMKANGPLAPLDVFKLGPKFLVVDGRHRLSGAKKLGWKEIECKVHEGDRRAAMLFTAGCNARHGQPLKRDEKRRAVYTLLADEEYFNWTDARIARHRLLLDCLVEGDPLGEVHRDVSVAFMAPVLVDLHDVGMVELASHLRLALEARDVLGRRLISVRSLNELRRWMTYTWSRESTPTPMAEPNTQWFGNGLGHSGSTSNWGAVLPAATIGSFSRAWPKASTTTAASKLAPPINPPRFNMSVFPSIPRLAA